MTIDSSTKHLPVGTIVAYAGEVVAGQEPAGWLLCNGGKLARADATYAELFAAIGTAYGAPDGDHFNVPNLQGVFLRGVTGASDKDPNATTRTASMPGGATGNEPGSIQPYATARPTTPFTATVENANLDGTSSNAGCEHHFGEMPSGTQEITMNGGGDHESRPINKYVHYLIKAVARANGSQVEAPIGAVIPFAGTNAIRIQQEWLRCNGTALSPLGEFGSLFTAIGVVHGGTSQNEFLLPAYDGYFLRGVANESTSDPDRDARTVPYPAGPSGKQGNAGDKVGSVQAFATGAPTQRAFVTTFPDMPSRSSKRIGGFSKRVYKINDAASTVVISAAGGDTETRPRNYAVSWYVRFRNQGAGFPVGAVIAYAGTLAPNDGWLACDGTPRAKDDLPELWDAIGYTYGEPEPGRFSLPDYRGVFLRGDAAPGGADPDVAMRTSAVRLAGDAPTFASAGGTATRVATAAASYTASTTPTVGTYQDCATARPVSSPFTMSVTGIPTSTEETHGIAGSFASPRSGGTLTTDTCDKGGDAETRPINVYVNYYIRARS